MKKKKRKLTPIEKYKILKSKNPKLEVLFKKFHLEF